MASTYQTPKPFTEQEHETIQLVSAIIGRCTFFTTEAVRNAFSWQAGILYRTTGYFTPRWRGVVMVIHSFSVVLSMPASLRLIKITSFAARDYLPWGTVVFEWLWSGPAILIWSIVTWALYRFTASISIFSMSLLLIKVTIARIDLVVFFGVCVWVLSIIYPGIWARAFIRCLQSSIMWTEAFWHSGILSVLTRLCYIHDGFMIKECERYVRRTRSALLNHQSHEGLVEGLEIYQYERLEGREFRLLKLTRPWAISPFECSLVVFDLHDAERPAFTAVSYEWGPNSELRPYNLRIGDKQLAVTESAYQVVRGLAPKSGEFYIWCDFICINQNDWDERASQVKMMGEIYTEAVKVTAFLNTASAVSYDESDLASYHLQKVNRSLDQPQWDTSRRSARFNQIKLDERGSPGWQALAKIFERQYWKRAWVVQEIVLAKQLVIIFGDNEFQWDELVRFVKAFEDMGNDGSLDVVGTILKGVRVPFAQIVMLLQISRIKDNFRQFGGLNLRETISCGPMFDATDPRDNLFALQGLCADKVPLLIQPDYHIRPVDLYINSVREIMTEGLWFLNYAGIGWGKRSLNSRLGNVSDDELPSWTPNWALTVNKRSLPATQVSRKSEESRHTLSEDARTLTVRSAIFGCIVKITEFPLLSGAESGTSTGILAPEELSRVAAATRQFQEDIETFLPVPYPTGIARDDAVWRVLLGNKQRDRDDIEYYSNSLTLWTLQAEFAAFAVSPGRSSQIPSGVHDGNAEKFQELVARTVAAIDRISVPSDKFEARTSTQESTTPALSPQQLEAMYRSATRLSSELGQHSAGRRAAFTDNGHIILAPPLAAPGDEVHFIASADTPFVLRPVGGKNERDGKYHLVGDCELYNGLEEMNKLDSFADSDII